MKKAVAITILLALLLSVVSCESSAPQTETQAQTTSGDTSEAEQTAAEAVEGDKPDFVEDDYDGETFTIFAPEWYKKEYYYAEEIDGDQMNDAVYERRILTENYLNIQIKYTTAGDWSQVGSYVGKIVNSGDDAYSLVMTHCFSSLKDMIVNNYLSDWNSLEYVDLTKDYYNQNVVENLTYADKLFYNVSDYMYADINTILFNKSLIADNGLDDPYTIVRSGGWTLDKLFSMAQSAARDLNGDGSCDVGDQYGLTGWGNWMMNSFLYSSGIRMVTKDDNGDFQISLYGEKTVKLIEKLDGYCNNNNYTYLWTPMAVPDDDIKVEMTTGRALFSLETVSDLPNYRETEVDFGVLPYPKYDEEQADYTNLNWSGLMCVPITVKNTELVGKTCELLSYFSGNTTVPAYYEVLLGDKVTRDKDSTEMLELIFDSAVYDPGFNFLVSANSINQLFYTIPLLVLEKKSADFASWYQKLEQSAQKEIDSFTEKYPK